MQSGRGLKFFARPILTRTLLYDILDPPLLTQEMLQDDVLAGLRTCTLKLFSGLHYHPPCPFACIRIKQVYCQ